MRERLHEAEMTTRYHDRERQSLVTQLSEQNGRLTAELQAASRREEELQTRLSELRGQVNDKRLSMQDHILYLENLKDEVLNNIFSVNFLLVQLVTNINLWHSHPSLTFMITLSYILGGICYQKKK